MSCGAIAPPTSAAYFVKMIAIGVPRRCGISN
jgi:hypothetical protein